VLALTLAFLVWALRAAKSWGGRGAAIAAALLVVGGVALAARPPTTADLVAEAWTPPRVAELQAAGTPVFVNFTADWCVTCKVNERTSLASPKVAQAFAQTGVTYLKADWTARDDVIAEALKTYGRPGVPLYLLFPAGGGPPTILPQTLTESIVIDAVRAVGTQPKGSPAPAAS